MFSGDSTSEALRLLMSTGGRMTVSDVALHALLECKTVGAPCFAACWHIATSDDADRPLQRAIRLKCGGVPTEQRSRMQWTTTTDAHDRGLLSIRRRLAHANI